MIVNVIYLGDEYVTFLVESVSFSLYLGQNNNRVLFVMHDGMRVSLGNLGDVGTLVTGVLFGVAQEADRFLARRTEHFENFVLM